VARLRTEITAAEDATRAAKRTLDSEIQRLTRDLASRDDDLASLNSRLQASTADAAAAARGKRDAEDRLAALRAEREEEVSSLKSQLTDAEAAARRARAATEEANARVGREVDAVTAQFAAERAKLLDEASRLRASIAAGAGASPVAATPPVSAPETAAAHPSGDAALVGRLQDERDAALTRVAGLELELEAVKGGHVADMATLRTQVLQCNETLRRRCARGYGWS
jgi:hypothetical protein